MTKTLFFPGAQLVTDFLVRQHLVGTIYALGNGFNLVKQWHVVGINRGKIADVRIGDFSHP